MPDTWEQRVIAAVLATDGVASGITAGMLWGLVDIHSGTVSVIIPRERRRKRNRIDIHRARLTRRDVRSVRGIPVTAPNRTLADLAGVLTEHRLEDALDKAIFLGFTSLKSLERYITGKKFSGAGRLRRLIADRAHGMTQSELERVFLRKVRKARMPEPVRQFAVGKRKIDVGYPEHSLVIELDGHGSRYARRDLQKHDRRQNEVVRSLSGWTLLRFTTDDVLNDWSYVEATVRNALA
jgi:very-short-patch-repair endonuclease